MLDWIFAAVLIGIWLLIRFRAPDSKVQLSVVLLAVCIAFQRVGGAMVAASEGSRTLLLTGGIFTILGVVSLASWVLSRHSLRVVRGVTNSILPGRFPEEDTDSGPLFPVWVVVIVVAIIVTVLVMPLVSQFLVR